MTKVAGAALLIVICGAVIWIGKPVLVPLILALGIWFILNRLAELLAELRIGSAVLPWWLRIAVAAVFVLFVIYIAGGVISSSVEEIADAVPAYEENISRLGDLAQATFGPRVSNVAADLVRQVSVGELLSRTVSAVTDLVGSLGMVIIYVAFLLGEQTLYDRKLRVIVRDPERRKRIDRLLNQIRADVQSYIALKTLMSLLTGGLSYAVLVVVGIDFAGFWAFLIFILNYIPTVGSLLGAMLPALLALVQFPDPMTPFLVTLVVLGTLQVVIGNFVEPRVMGRTLNISPFVVIVALVVWSAMWGVIGAFLSVPLMVVAMILMANFPSTQWVARALSADGLLPHQDEPL